MSDTLCTLQTICKTVSGLYLEAFTMYRLNDEEAIRATLRDGCIEFATASPLSSNLINVKVSPVVRFSQRFPCQRGITLIDQLLADSAVNIFD